LEGCSAPKLLDEVNAMKNNRFYGFLTATLLTIATALPVQASESVQWLWSATAPHVNRSTEALANHHPQRAARLATSAINATLPSDRLIARHNLCIALLMQRDVAAAEPHCRTALQTPAPLPVARIRGALMLASHGSPGAPTLDAVIKANIARVYGDGMVNIVASAAP